MAGDPHRGPRRLVIVPVERRWAHGRNAANERKTPGDSIWEHTRTFLRVESVERRDGAVIERDVRFHLGARGHASRKGASARARLGSTTAGWSRGTRASWCEAALGVVVLLALVPALGVVVLLALALVLADARAGASDAPAG